MQPSGRVGHASSKALNRREPPPERLYAIFRVAPFGAPRIRTVKQERKHYHFRSLI